MTVASLDHLSISWKRLLRKSRGSRLTSNTGGKSTPNVSFEEKKQTKYAKVFVSARKSIEALSKLVGWVTFLLCCFLIAYFLVSSPPLHWFYESAPSAGPASIYLPGGGFSGFWFHAGYLHALQQHRDLDDFDYYCYSAGCLSILSAFMNRSMEEIYSAALRSQVAWMNGNHSRFDIVDYFFDELVPPKDDVNRRFSSVDGKNDRDRVKDFAIKHYNFLPRIKILVTNLSDERGHQVMVAKNRKELKEYIRSTTWIPYITGWGFAPHIDGAFSRFLHPQCATEWHLPLTWDTALNSLSPGLSREQVQTLWESGGMHSFPLPTKTDRITEVTNPKEI